MIQNKDDNVKERHELHEIQKITEKEISIKEILDSIRDNDVGATVLFIGTVRNFSEVDTVVNMYYESYTKMAEERIQIIIDDAKQKWNINCRLLHRMGDLEVGDVSVVVAVSSSHRHDAFDACQYLIERIKRAAPIWKKERLIGGEMGERIHH